MLDKIYTIEEVKKISGHFWDTIEPIYNFENMGYEIASHFASKKCNINDNNGKKYFSFIYNSFSINSDIHDSRYALLSRIGYAFKEKYNIIIEAKNIKWVAQLDNNFHWLLIKDNKTRKKLVFKNL